MVFVAKNIVFDANTIFFVALTIVFGCLTPCSLSNPKAHREDAEGPGETDRSFYL
jgi:hypothetical protein